jgi:hypothetical protein
VSTSFNCSVSVGFRNCGLGAGGSFGLGKEILGNSNSGNSGGFIFGNSGKSNLGILISGISKLGLFSHKSSNTLF